MFATIEQKLCNTYRELFGIVYSLTIYEHLADGSDHFINLLNDRKPNHSCSTNKGNISQRFAQHKPNQPNFRNFVLFIPNHKILL